MMLPDPNDSGSPIRKNFLASAANANNNANTSNNNNMTTINQHLNNLGSINHQLNTLSQQLCGLNQQSQNLQNFQSLAGNNAAFNHQLLPLSSLSNLSQQISPASQQHQQKQLQPNQDLMQQQDLFQSNQELLNRLQNLSLGYSNNNSINNYSPQNSFIYTNPNQMVAQSLTNNNNNNINMNLLSSPPSTAGNLTPSPILNRSPYSVSPSLFDDNLGLSMDRNLDRMHNDNHQFIRPLSQVSTMTTVDSDGKVKVIVPVASSPAEHSLRYDSGSGGSYKKSDKKVTLPDFVTLKVTDESGNITNSRKLSATPSFITRSTSEKVPNRSQIMSEVQRTTWARHTTK